MNLSLRLLLAAASLCLIASCKPSEEKAATSQKLSDAVSALGNAFPTGDMRGALPVDVRNRLASSCGRLAFLEFRAEAPACDVPEIFELFERSSRASILTNER